MATRMQQRRGTSTQWSTANPILNEGEIGFEIDTNQFKIGDGTNHWNDLSYFIDETSLTTSLGDYVKTSLLGIANGVATLNSSGQLESSQLPNIDEISQDAVNNALSAGTGITKTYDDNANTITISVDTSVIATKAELAEAAQDSINDALSVGAGITKTYDDSANTLTLNIDSNVVATVTGLQTLSDKVLGNAVSLGANLDASSHTITNLASPSNANDAATKSYVDALSEGLHIHASAVAATTENINLATDLENGDVIDGVTLVTGKRVLVKNQSTPSQNGIYVVQPSGAAVRATDFDTPSEVDGGDFIFITGGTVNADTGWVQTSEIVATIGVDPIFFTQFSGAGTFLAGNGLTLTGSTFSIDTLVTADISSSQTLLNKTISLANNTISGTLSQFNSAVSDADLVSLTGSETLTNKTLTAPSLTETSKIQQILEKTTVSATAATGTINYELLTNGSITYYTSNASGNWTLNVRGNSSTTLNSVMATGDSLTIAFLVTNGATPYRQTAFQIDGSSVTPKWQGGTAPSAGNANSIDIYSVTIIKTGNATFTALESLTKFA